MKAGDFVELTELITSMKKKGVYGNSGDLVTITSVGHYPVLIVQHLDTKNKFPVRVERVTTELSVKSKIKLERLKKELEKLQKENDKRL